MAMPTTARAYGSVVWHDLNRGAAAPRTLCGRDAALMARFSPADLPSGERAHKPCERCRVVRGLDHAPSACTCGARDLPSCLCGLTPARWVAAHPERPVA